MGLKRIVSALLPRDYREQVLGDLEERGFPVRDVIFAIPQIWWSHLNRACGIPKFAGAGPGELRHVLSSHARRSVLNATVTGFCLGILNGGVYRELSVRRVSLPLIAAIGGYALSVAQLKFRMRKVPRSPEGWSAFYGRRLASELRYVKRGGIELLLLLTLIQVGQEVWPSLNTGDLLIRVGYILPVYGFAVIVNRPRIRFIRNEIEGLQ